MTVLHALNYQDSQDNTPSYPSKLKITETQYWEAYYDNSEVNYEWNNGYLEENPVSDYATLLMYQWFFKTLEHYLTTHQIAKFVMLEMGFRLALPHKTTIRKPDLGVVLNNNPTPLTLEDNTYQGIFDLCIEVLSNSSAVDINRDTITKKGEYATAGVKEYYILYGHEDYTAFYHLNASGVYVPLPQIDGDIIQSTVLPSFQFRLSDLHKRPSSDEMIDDPVYQGFVLPGYQKAKQNAYFEKQARKKAEKIAQAEKIAREKAEVEIIRLKALLAENEK